MDMISKSIYPVGPIYLTSSYELHRAQDETREKKKKKKEGNKHVNFWEKGISLKANVGLYH